MRAAAAALWRALLGAAAAGTLADTIRDGIALATWALEHPGQFSAVVHLARGIGFAADAFPSREEAAALVAAREDAREHKHGGR